MEDIAAAADSVAARRTSRRIVMLISMSRVSESRVSESCVSELRLSNS
jgi:hypothetical protein